jgi:chromosome segregation ATPase
MEPESLESRVAALETQVRDLDARLTASAQDAAAARVLAGAADRDVSEFRGELRDFRQAVASSFNALREDMNDRFARVDQQFARVDQQFARVEEQFARVEEQFGRVDDGFMGIRGKLDAAAAGQQHIAKLLQHLIDKPDQ